MDRMEWNEIRKMLRETPMPMLRSKSDVCNISWARDSVSEFIQPTFFGGRQQKLPHPLPPLPNLNYEDPKVLAIALTAKLIASSKYKHEELLTQG
jgi:hypothetical protein